MALAGRGIVLLTASCVLITFCAGEQGPGSHPQRPCSGEDRPTAVLVSDDILAVALEKACIGLGLLHTGDYPSCPLTIPFARLTFPSPTSRGCRCLPTGNQGSRPDDKPNGWKIRSWWQQEIIVPHMVGRRAAPRSGGSAVIEYRNRSIIHPRQVTASGAPCCQTYHQVRPGFQPVLFF